MKSGEQCQQNHVILTAASMVYTLFPSHSEDLGTGLPDRVNLGQALDIVDEKHLEPHGSPVLPLPQLDGAMDSIKALNQS